MGLSHSPLIVTNGLNLYYDFANKKSYAGSGSTVSDLSSTKNNGTLANAPVYSDNSLLFNGTSQYIAGTSSITVKTVIAWVKQAVAGADGVVYGLDANGSDNWLSVTGNVVQLAVTQVADVNNTAISGTTVLNTSQYYQIAATIDSSSAQVYCNGIQENSVSTAFTIGAWTATPYIGRRGTLAQKYFSGNIAIVSAYDRVLTPAEIKQNFNALRGRFGL